MAESRWSRIDPRIRTALRQATLATHGPTCHLCGGQIDLRLPRRHPGAYTIDHLIPPGRGGNLTDPANLRPAHWGCNAGKRDRQRTSAPAPDWTPRLEW